jgi:hypothetical protein
VTVKGFSITEGPDALAINNGTIFVNSGDPAATALALHATGVTGGDAIDGYIFGRLADKHFTWAPEVTAALAGQTEPAPEPAAPQPLTLTVGQPGLNVAPQVLEALAHGLP